MQVARHNEDCSRDTTSAEMETPTVLGGLWNAAALSAVIVTQHREKTNTSTTTKDYDQYAHDCFHDSLTSNMVRLGSSGISLPSRQLLGGKLGTGTLLTLPNGDHFDTRTIGKKGFHKNNNRLLNDPMSSVNNHPRGMVDNLYPDYRCLPDECRRATEHPSTIHRQFTSPLEVKATPSLPRLCVV